MGNLYTQEGIMSQVFVSFGQGTGAIRVSQDAAVKLRTLYFNAITPTVIAQWDACAAQVLERIRAIGRLSALTATQRGDTMIVSADVQSSAVLVQTTSMTDFCPPIP